MLNLDIVKYMLNHYQLTFDYLIMLTYLFELYKLMKYLMIF